MPQAARGCASGGWLGTNAQALNDYVAAHLWADRPGVLRGPDLYAYFQANPGLLRDCIHPTYTAAGGALNGYEQWQRLWRDALLANVYNAAGATPSLCATPAPCGRRFGDVLASDPACAAVEALAARGIIRGCDAAVFGTEICALTIIW